MRRMRARAMALTPAFVAVVAYAFAVELLISRCASLYWPRTSMAGMAALWPVFHCRSGRSFSHTPIDPDYCCWSLLLTWTENEILH